MFGGLDIKGKSGGSSASGGGSSSQDGGGDASTEPAAAPPSTSAFGFLNAGASTATAAELPAVPAPATTVPNSGFSFLNATATSTDVAGEAPAPATATSDGSGFSFLQEMSAPAAAALPEAEDPPATTSAPTSAFGFMIPTPSSDALDDTTEPAPPPGAGSGFSFLASPSPVTTTADADASEMLAAGNLGGGGPPSAVHARTMSTSSVNSGVSEVTTVTTPPLMAAANVLEMAMAPAHSASTFTSSTAAGLPTGAGVTFGTSTIKRVGVKKKKNRAPRVGAGIGAGIAAAAQPSPAMATPSTMASAAAAGEDEKSARDAAAEAQRRAAEFMQAKTREEAAAPPPPAPAVATTGPPAIQPSNSTDEVVAAAQAAAEEAKILQQQQEEKHQKSGGGGFMGTFFKGFGAKPHAPSGNGAHHSSSDSASAAAAGGGSVDRLAKEQQGMQRAMAERQMHMQNAATEDDDDVVVSTSVAGYHVEPVSLGAPPPETTSASSFTPITLPPKNATLSSSSATISTAFSPSKAPFAPVAKSQPPVAPPTFRMAKTSTMIFEEHQAMFAQSVQRAMEQVENVRSQQKMLSEERFVAIAKDRLATQQIAQTETQLQAAVEEEDYELADQLGQIVEAHKREKDEVATMLENITKALAQLDSQKSLVVKGVATCFDNLTFRLEELKEKEAASEQKDDEETFKQFASISKQLSAEHERLAQDQKHLERDEKLVGEERKELEDSISEQTGEIEKSKEEASTKLTEVQHEIDELRKRLEIKQKEAADLRTEMFGFEDAISKVRVKFSRQLTRLDKKERALKESRAEWEAESSTHKKQKEAHELQVQSHSEALLAHDALQKSLESELTLSKEFSELIPKHFGFLEDEKKDDAKRAYDTSDENDLAQLQADVVKCEAAVSEGKVLLKAAASALTNLQSEHDCLIASIPQLEAQKKAAAAKRDFKAASKASKDIKDATLRLKECEDELRGEALSRKTAAEEELKKLDGELAQTREIAQAKEKLCGLERMTTLAKQIGKLLDTKKEICGESTSRENTVRGVCALVLEGQITALKNEGNDLGIKYGGWIELIKELSLDDPEIADSGGDEKEPVAAEDNAPVPPLDDGLTSEERVAKVRQLMAKLGEVEARMEDAAGREEFEEAASLQEALEAIQQEMEVMNLTDEEVELAMSDDIPTPAPSLNAEDEEKKETPDEEEEEPEEKYKDTDMKPSEDGNEHVEAEPTAESTPDEVVVEEASDVVTPAETVEDAAFDDEEEKVETVHGDPPQQEDSDNFVTVDSVNNEAPLQAEGENEEDATSTLDEPEE